MSAPNSTVTEISGPVIITPGTVGTVDQVVTSDGVAPTWADSSGGTVTSVSVVTANGVSGSVATASTTPAVTLTLGAITPTSVVASGNVSAVGLRVTEGANGKQGVTTLSGGASVVSNTSVTADSRIFLSVQSLGTVTVPTPIAVTARDVGVSFTVTSSNVIDTSVIAFEIFEPNA